MNVSELSDEKHGWLTDHVSFSDGVHFVGAIGIVVENNVRNPNIRGGNFHHIDATVLTGRPDQLVICPFLQRGDNQFRLREELLLTCCSQTLVVMI